MFKQLIASRTIRARVALIVAAVLIVPVAISLTVTQLPFARRGDTAGRLFGKAVPMQTFQEERRWVQQQADRQFGGASSESLAPLVTQWAWDKLMLEAEAKRTHLRVNDQELAAFLQKIPAFQDHGVFRPERYHGYLESAGNSAQAFEALLRRDLLVEKLEDSIKASVRVSDDDVKAAYRQSHESLKVSLIRVMPDAFISAANAAVTDADGHAYAETHPAEELANAKEQLVQALARVRARAEAETLRTRLMAKRAIGVRYEEAVLIAGVAPIHLIISRGQSLASLGLTPEVTTAVFALSPGALTPVIETPNGFIIARSEEQIPADESAFAASKETVRADVVKEWQATRWDQWLAEVRTRAKLQSAPEP